MGFNLSEAHGRLVPLLRSPTMLMLWGIIAVPWTLMAVLLSGAQIWFGAPLPHQHY